VYSIDFGNHYRRWKMATAAQRQMFNPEPSGYSEKRASLLREWYRKGQAAFRGALCGHQFQMTSALNDLTQDLKDGPEKDGLLMGWQSDAYAWDNGLEFSVEGSDAVGEEDLR
jgi:hypothetical protein